MSVTKIPVDGLSGGEGILSAAYAGVLETNATFVDQAIFGPSVDGKSWNGKWTGNDSSGDLLFTSLMLVTIEDTGSDTQVNIWDLTEQSGGAPSTTSLGTVTITGAATPTSVAACMGYIIIGSEDGISIIDPHSGSWAERTSGWPKSLTSSTTPALTDNDVAYVAAGISPAFPLDPRTGGPMPSFAVAYGTGADVCGLIKYDGNVHNKAGTIEASGQSVALYPQGYIANTFNTGDRVDVSNIPISEITADDWSHSQSMSTLTGPNGFGATNGMNVSGDLMVGAHANGLTFSKGAVRGGGATGVEYATAMVNRTYNTGNLFGDIRGAWLANSVTADRSYKANTLTHNGGGLTEAAVETSAELMGYSGWSGSNYLTDAFDADFDFGTGSFSLSFWAKANGTGTGEYWLFGRHSASHFWYIQFRGNDSDKFRFEVSDGSSNIRVSSSGGNDDNTWHHIVAVFDSSGATDEGRIYRDGALEGTHVLAMNTVTDPDGTIGIGAMPNGSGSAGGVTLALARVSATAPTATQIRQMYDAEKPMFVASAECLLQSSSTDAVLDVDVDPLTGKVLVTQTDAITIFDGLAVDKLFADAGKPTVNSGSSEKGKLWGDLRTEQNTANAYVTAPAVDQRQVNEMVRGLASDMPAGPDLSKAAAWISFKGTTNAVLATFNIKSYTDLGTGHYRITLATPFKNPGASGSPGFAVVGMTENEDIYMYDNGSNYIDIKTEDQSSIADTGFVMLVFFGELENE
jgi:hypothetical protein